MTLACNSTVMCRLFVFTVQMLTTGSYQPISSTLTAVDNITKEDVVKVRWFLGQHRLVVTAINQPWD